MTRATSRKRLAAAVACVAVLGVGCAGASSPEAGDDAVEDTAGEDGARTIQSAQPCVEGAVRPEPLSVAEAAYDGLALTITPPVVAPAPEIIVVIDNRDDVAHEFVMVRGNIDTTFVREPDGSLPEFGPGVGEGRVIARIARIEPGGRCELYLDVPSGSYTMFSNLVVDGVAYVDEGAIAPFQVAGEFVTERSGPPPQADLEPDPAP